MGHAGRRGVLHRIVVPVGPVYLHPVLGRPGGILGTHSPHDLFQGTQNISCLGIPLSCVLVFHTAYTRVPPYNLSTTGCWTSDCSWHVIKTGFWIFAPGLWILSNWRVRLCDVQEKGQEPKTTLWLVCRWKAP